MQRYLGILFLIFMIFSCKPSASTEEVKTNGTDTTATSVVPIPGLKRLWDTEATLTTAESVLYDKTNNLLYVSCINGVPPNKKDGDGFISRVRLDGKIADLLWVTGLDAPKGMGLYGTTLYVTDIDRLVAIDITTGKINNTWKVKGSVFLNDVHVQEDGKVYFTDSSTSTIYALMNEKVSVIHADTSLGGTNGVLVEGNTMYLAGFMSGKVFTMDIPSHKIRQLAEGVPGGDGIERYGEGLLVSNWNGEVYHVSPGGEVTILLNTQEAKLNAADIEVIAEKNLLLVPTFFGNSVTAYELIKN